MNPAIISFLWWFTLLACLSGSGLIASEAASRDFFEQRVRPLLAEKCFACHTTSEMSGLRLDSREALLRGGSRGPAIKPGSAEDSLLIQAVRHSRDDLKMPPTGRLANDEIASLEKWVRDGAVWPAEPAPVSPQDKQFWSLQPVEKPPLPEVRRKTWPHNATDYFVLARLENEGLEPAREADRRTLIRRATFDLTGLPPTPEEVETFLADDSPDAFGKVIERLLASPHYGERWARYWLDLARYADGVSGPRVDTPLPNAYRYRDWVVKAFNGDMPYDLFIKAQLAADLMRNSTELLPALGFHALRGKDDDRVDVTGRVFLGLTVGCAQCHDHKYDPIPTQDFYSLQGVFSSSEPWEYPLAPEQEVKAYKKAQERIEKKKIELEEFLKDQSDELIDILIARTADYVVSAWEVGQGGEPASVAERNDLDLETLKRWVVYLGNDNREHRYLEDWDGFVRRGGSLDEARTLAGRFADDLRAIHREKRSIDDRNYVKLGGREGARDQKVLLNTNLEFIDPAKWYLWRDICSEPFKKDGLPFDGGVLYYGPENVRRFLSKTWRRHVEKLEAELKALEEAAPEPYPFIHGYRDAEKPEDLHVAIRGDKKNLGELAPRRFLRILSEGEPQPFTKGSGRLELAEAIASPGNPLAARVMVNRVWAHHFGRGLVTTPSNFGWLGERPSHPKLLDYLAAKFVEGGWSIKALHREIMLSATYRLSTEFVDRNYEKDADNRFYWRANLQKRLDAEALRDALLAVAGNLDFTLGGVSEPLTDENLRRAIYGQVSRTTPDPGMTLFDFPDPKTSAPERGATLGPLQRLYFLNSSFVQQQARVLAERLEREAGPGEEAKIERAYSLLYSRPPEEKEIEWALNFVHEHEEGWTKYAQMLLASAEFSSVN